MMHWTAAEEVQGRGKGDRHICLLARKAQHELSIFPYGFSQPQPQPQQAMLLHLKLPLPLASDGFHNFRSRNGTCASGRANNGLRLGVGVQTEVVMRSK